MWNQRSRGRLRVTNQPKITQRIQTRCTVKAATASIRYKFNTVLVSVRQCNKRFYSHDRRPLSSKILALKQRDVELALISERMPKPESPSFANPAKDGPPARRVGEATLRGVPSVCHLSSSEAVERACTRKGNLASLSESEPEYLSPI